MGPRHIYMKLALLTFYTPYWRKCCRMLCKMRSMNHVDFSGRSRDRLMAYAKRAYKDTKMPEQLKWVLAGCIQTEFKFDVRWGLTGRL